MGEYYLKDVVSLVENYSSKTTNPSIWVKDRSKHNGLSYTPSNIYIDDWGDIIIEVDKEVL